MTRTFTAHTPKRKASGTVSLTSTSVESSRATPPKKVTRQDLERAHEARLQRERELMEGIEPQKEIGGPEGPEPTRYGDWERKGICVDF